MVALAFSQGTFPHSSNVDKDIRTFLTTPNGVVVIALLSTYGVYIASAILFLDPWHLVTSFVQYNLMTLAYINILNVYAFCNWHDLSWGTKESDKADLLPSARLVKTDAEGAVEVLEYELPQADIDSIFEKVVKRTLSPIKKVKTAEKSSIDDYNRGFRMNLVAAWIFSYLPFLYKIER